jgi:hypothetical protein
MHSKTSALGVKLNDYKKIIQEKRRNTSTEDFVTEILSWVPMTFYKNS